MQSYEIKYTSPGVLGQLQTGAKEGSQLHPLRPPWLFTSNTADITSQYRCHSFVPSALQWTLPARE